MKAKRIVTGLAIALVVAVGLALPEAASADRGSGLGEKVGCKDSLLIAE